MKTEKSMLISFPDGLAGRNKQRPLSKIMVFALIAACERQKGGIPFGPNHIKGSFTGLITKQLVVCKDITVNEKSESIWEVTAAAIDMLHILGIETPC